ncbi:hypothetical protein FIU87_20400 [Bacillus sp. THAF10]|uniref:hypothetical protein n=1 Tax=Bacillus sp. THAF10 TaxID=2587848 RepID=UPI0012696514|nr:hypothetical protein [Bacillus sp. THAF10]QFT91014.1 hypothetical protein FIU87_20400 [Bacillus sp. THAF10]
MALVIYLILTWLFGAIFLFQRKKLIFIENLLLFLFFLFVNKTVLTLISLNLGLIFYNKEPALFLCFWLHRNILAPILLMIFANAAFQNKIGRVMVYGLITMLVRLSLEALGIQLNIIQFHMWSYTMTSIVSIVYISGTLFLVRAYRHLLIKDEMVRG